MPALLSDRIRANSEAAPWVVEEVKALEACIENYGKAFDALAKRLGCEPTPEAVVAAADTTELRRARDLANAALTAEKESADVAVGLREYILDDIRDVVGGSPDDVGNRVRKLYMMYLGTLQVLGRVAAGDTDRETVDVIAGDASEFLAGRVTIKSCGDGFYLNVDV